jgi:hypothetical protein
MAIQPIDLQALFSQVDKVGKTQSDLKEGLQLQQALQGAQSQRKLDERIRSVNEAQDSGEGADRIRDRNSRRRDRRGAKEKDNTDGTDVDDGADSEQSEVVRDPALGHNIDLSG